MPFSTSRSASAAHAPLPAVSSPFVIGCVVVLMVVAVISPPPASARKRRRRFGRAAGAMSARIALGEADEVERPFREARRRRRRGSRGCGTRRARGRSVPVLPLMYVRGAVVAAASAATFTRCPARWRHVPSLRSNSSGSSTPFSVEDRLDREQPALVVRRSARTRLGRHALDAASQLVDVHQRQRRLSAPTSASVSTSQSASSCSSRSIGSSVGSRHGRAPHAPRLRAYRHRTR